MSRVNNFDLIRLVAAMQVFSMHAIAWLKVPIPSILAEVLDWFPGVPIFFMISGCLVTHSFTRLPTLSEYFRNRALRVFPGLWVCLVVSYMIVAWRGGLDQARLLPKTLFWLATQGSFFQFVDFYVNPGVTNGVLWSISTELQFYLALPLVALLGKRYVLNRRWVTAILLLLAIASGAIHEWVLSHQEQLLPRLFPTLYASIFANGYFFAFGVIAYLWKDQLFPLLANRFAFFSLFYVSIRVSLALFGIEVSQVHSTMLGLLVYPVLGLSVFAFAFSFDGLSQRLLRGNDFSYGMYIYHMPIVYCALHYGLESWFGLLPVAISGVLLSILSWYFVERPMLRLKRDG